MVFQGEVFSPLLIVASKQLYAPWREQGGIDCVLWGGGDQGIQQSSSLNSEQQSLEKDY